MKKSINEVYNSYGLKSKGYYITTIDGEDIIYKDYGNFDIEVSGLDNYRKSRISGIVFVWEKKRRIVKNIEYKSFNQLNNILCKIDVSSLEEIVNNDSLFDFNI